MEINDKYAECENQKHENQKHENSIKNTVDILLKNGKTILLHSPELNCLELNKQFEDNNDFIHIKSSATGNYIFIQKSEIVYASLEI